MRAATTVTGIVSFALLVAGGMALGHRPPASPAQSLTAARVLTVPANGPQVDLSCGLGNPAGENIGDWSPGINDTKLNSMFMASADHRANILGPYHYVATAWVVGANGAGYIAVEFA